MRILVAGAGEKGLTIAERFSKSHDTIVVDWDAQALTIAEDRLDSRTVLGDVMHRELWSRVEAKRIDVCVLVTGSDGANLAGAGLAREAGAKVIIARVDDPGFYAGEEGAEWNVLGADAVLCATRLAASELLGQLAGSELSQVRSFAAQGLRCGLATVRLNGASELGTSNSSANSRRIRVEESLVGLEPDKLKLPKEIRLGAVVRDGFLRHTASVSKFEKEDSLLLCGDSLSFLDAWLRLYPEAKKQRAVIVGGGVVGAQIASVLATRLEKVELIEKDRALAEKLSGVLKGVTVLVGDARQASVLKNFQIEGAEVLMAVTSDDEVNLLVALLARRLGIPRIHALVRHPGHSEVFDELGVYGVAEHDVLATTVEEVAIASGLVLSKKLQKTSYDLVEWRLPQLKTDKAYALRQVPLSVGTHLLGLCRGTQILEAKPDCSLEGGEILLLAVAEREKNDQTAQLLRFHKEAGR